MLDDREAGWSKRTGPPPRRLGSARLYGDLLLLVVPRFGGLGQRNGQDALLEGRRDLVGIDPLGHGEAALEGTVAALAEVEVFGVIILDVPILWLYIGVTRR